MSPTLQVPFRRVSSEKLRKHYPTALRLLIILSGACRHSSAAKLAVEEMVQELQMETKHRRPRKQLYTSTGPFQNPAPYILRMAATLASTFTMLSTGPCLPRDKYRGAVVEDMQLPPAFSLHQDERLDKAIELAYDRDFSHIPILSRERRPLGYLDVSQLKSKWEAGGVDPKDSVLTHMTKFKRNPKNGYTLITPLTPLEVLEQFLDDNLFALVTDQSRKFVLAVATRHDLENFVTRRGRGFY